MNRRPSLPGAAELFRSTGGSGTEAPSPAPEARRPAETRRPADRAAERLSRLGAPREEESPSTSDDELEIGASVTALPAEPAPSVRGLRPSTADDDFADVPRSPARIRQTRRQPLRGGADRRPSGREKHDEKITVYCSAEELFELERARLALRGDHGMVVDRGRIVREAVAVVLADLDAKGESSILVRRLRES
ncbi:MAG TPA: hypothetical protein VI357_27205 [Mycobacteriales bacterium]